MADYKKQENPEIKFVYEPAEPKAPFDKSFHTKKEDGTYKYHGKYSMVKYIEELEEIRDLYKGKVIAVDTETTGLTSFQDYIVGFSLALSSSVESTAYYVPVRHKVKQEIDSKKVTKLDENGNVEFTPAGRPRTHTVKEYVYHSSPYNVKPREKYLIKKFTLLDKLNVIKTGNKINIKKHKLKQRLDSLKYTLKYNTENYDKLALDIFYEIILNAKGNLLHNAEFDLVMLQGEGYDTKPIKFYDTLTLAHMIDPESHLKSLKACEKYYLARHRPNFEETIGGSENFQFTDPRETYFYAAVDAQNTMGLYEVLKPKLLALLSKYKEVVTLDGKKYDVIKQDNTLVKAFVEYYGHALIHIDKQIALEYKEKIINDLIGLRAHIYGYFNRGTFNLSTSSKEFKQAMVDKNIVTGHLTDTGNASYGKDGLKEFNRNLKFLEVFLKHENCIEYNDSIIDIRAINQPVNNLTLAKVLDTYGKDYFNGKYVGNNSYRVVTKDKKILSKKEFMQALSVMFEKEKEKFEMLKSIQKNSSLNKAVNSYIEKLTLVDNCRMRYKLYGTRSGRLASGNGSKSDKKVKNRYYIDLNAQNLSKPSPAYYKATQANSENSILGWDFELVSDEYAKENLEKEYIVEGFSPNLNIRNCIVAPKGKIVMSIDYCIDPNSVVELECGDKVPLKYLDNNPQKIKTPEGFKTAFNFRYTGKKKKCILKLKDGTEVVCSQDHKFKVKTLEGNLEWKQLKDILPSDSILTDR